MSQDVSYEEFIDTIKEIFNAPDTGAASRDSCMVTPVLDMLQGKWKNHILFAMCRYNSIRFGELKRILPEITNTMLTTTLRELESYGLVNRIQYNEIPPHVEYSLTEKGRDLMPIYYVIFQWALKYNT